MSDDEMSIAEAQQELGVSHVTIGNMIKDGRLTAREEPHGKQIRRYVRRKDVEALKPARPPSSSPA